MESIQNKKQSENLEETFEEDLAMDESNESYKVESWPEGEEDPVGFKMRGKFVFGKTVEVLKLRLKKSKIAKKFQDIEYLVTDVRKVKHGTEVDLEISKKEKGGACIKFFGPNKKNEYTVVVNKMKKYPQKYVKMVATKLIIPMIDTCISSMNIEVADLNFCCTECGKTFVSDKNLKIHKARMHMTVSDKKELKIKRKNMSTLKQNKSTTMDNMQSLYNYTCKSCDFKTVDIDLIKRHQRDIHNVVNSCYSPNWKKTEEFDN